jgi:hypothetical protein
MSDLDALPGVWILRSVHVEDPATGQRFKSPYGENPKGALILHPEGRMMAMITPGDQQRPHTDAETADAFRRMIAYSGRYRLEPPNRFITTVDLAWFPLWLGTEQARIYKLDGDRLDVISAPGRMPHSGDALVVGILSWSRERP